MTQTRDDGLIGIAPSILITLRQSMERVWGDQAAPVLQEAGFASGDEIYKAFQIWLETRHGISAAEDLDAAFLGEVMSEFFQELGWGSLTIDRIGPAALVIDVQDWAECSGKQEDVPSCHVTTGLLAAFLGRLAEDVVAVMEVECCSNGDRQSRFLVGAPETLQVVFEGMSQGADYEGVLTTTGRVA